jgi:Protein of unknown function (DUF1592)/Protein of unknown function (DUF1588)/Protein of unknown function (DUF1595)/Protein of unknown function (DUF1585)/Protein of unknown function (DUF1587)
VLRPCLVALAAIVTASGCAGEGVPISGTAGNPGTAGNISGTAGNGGPGTAGNGGPGTAGDSGTAGASGPGTGGGPTVTPPKNALTTPSPCTSSAPGPRKVWRLSAPQFAASIRAIFNDTTGAAPVGTVFSDPTNLGFAIDANGLLVQGLNASQLQDNAEAIAAWAVSASKLSVFASCTTLDATCGAKFVQGFGRRAFRTTLAASDARVTAYTKLFMTGSSFSDGAQMVIAAMLQSPYFLYRSEVGTQSGSTFTLTPFEVATELAYLLTGSTPDDTLLGAADSVVAGSLTLSAMIDQQATRLLATGAASNSTAVMGFMTGWLGLDRLYTTAHDDTVFMMPKAIRDDMNNESKSLLLEAFNGGGSFSSVLTADHTFLNAELATFYGLPTTGLTTAFKSVPLSAGSGRDPGLLATGTILNAYARPDTSSPTQRGHLVRTRMLCQDVPPPPPNIDTTFHPSTTPETTRDHFVNSHEAGACASCHLLMDWIGFGFENYDGWGRYRTTENNLPIDDSLTIYSDPKGASPMLTGLSGANSLSSYLAASDDAKRCMLRYWTYYAYGASTWAEDACTYDAIYQEASSNSFALKSALLAIIHAKNFTQRVQDP